MSTIYPMMCVWLGLWVINFWGCESSL
jgi:hypothetical protein